MHKVVYILACLVGPILWGAVVNWLFDLWQERSVGKSDDEPIFPDYQI